MALPQHSPSPEPRDATTDTAAAVVELASVRGADATSPERRSPDLPVLSGSLLLVTFILGTIGTAIAWTRCAFGHSGFLQIHDAAEMICIVAGVAAFAVAGWAITTGVRMRRRRAGAGELWFTNLALAGLAFGGASLQLMLLKLYDLAPLPLSQPLIDALPGAAAFALASGFGFTVAGIMLAARRRVRSGRSARLYQNAVWLGMAGIVATWITTTLVTWTPLGIASVGWTFDPTFALATFALCAPIAAVFLALTHPPVTIARRSIVAGSLAIGVGLSSCMVLLLQAG